MTSDGKRKYFNSDQAPETAYPAASQEQPQVTFAPNIVNEKLGRPMFKGSLEDLVTITNFKRFKRKGSSSKYKGVFFVKKEKKFRAQICLGGKKKYVGTFKNDRDAAIARDQKIREMFGEVEELLNFPLSKNDDSQHNKLEARTMLANLTTAEEEGKNRVAHWNRLSNLTRYSSSGSSLNIPFMQFQNRSQPNEEETAQFQQPHVVEFQSQPNLHFPGSFGYAVPDPAHYRNYNSLMNFNLQDIGLNRPRHVLSKRFSSNDSCFSFSLQAAEALNQSLGKSTSNLPTNQSEERNLESPAKKARKN